jgi:hypothetical protein
MCKEKEYREIQSIDDVRAEMHDIVNEAEIRGFVGATALIAASWLIVKGHKIIINAIVRK